MAVPCEKFPLRPPPGPGIGKRTQESSLNNPGPSIAALVALVAWHRKTAAES
jgi:hypothetical protein